MHQRGRFITLEGGEGVGKSTNMAFVVECLETAGKEVIQTREPGGTPAAETLRQLLLDPHASDIWCGEAELLLMFAARAQHIQKVILPALERGIWVVCDRFTDATFAYQGGGRGLSRTRIEVLEALFQQGLQPDLTLLLDMPPHDAHQRVSARLDAEGGSRDRFEREQAGFFDKVRDAYRERAVKAPARIRTLDASLPLASVQERIKAHLVGCLEVPR